MADSAELAFNEILNEMKTLSKQIKFKLQRADTSCNNIKFSKKCCN